MYHESEFEEFLLRKLWRKRNIDSKFALNHSQEDHGNTTIPDAKYFIVVYYKG